MGLALYAGAALVVGTRLRRPALAESGARAVLAHFGFVTLAFLALEYALVTSDFSLRYVANNSARAYALWYRIAGLWAALEGSLVLWEWMQAGLGVVVLLWYRKRQPELFPVAAATLMGISAFFLTVLAFAADPFAPVTPVPPDGRGMNPLLEDTSMLVHPLLLYSGWTGFTVPYAFAMAALITGRLSEEWVLLTRRWAVGAWFFMTAGIIYGGWWSYHVLGWGGYWAWDPVENASFLPWLTATAYIHSVMVQERRRMLRIWNLVLLILTFSLIVFGTFLTRSGVIASVHSFTQSPVGYFFLVYLALVLLFSLGWVAARADRLRGQSELDSLVSRESAFLLNNLAFVGICFTVFFGTIFPLLAEAVRGVKMSVGTPYFNRVVVPTGLGLLGLMGVGPLIPWRRAGWASLRRTLLWPTVVALATGIVLAGFGVRRWAPLLGLMGSAFVAASVVQEFIRGAALRRTLAGEGPGPALLSLFRINRRRYGGYLVHFGVAILVVGLAVSSSYQKEREVQLRPGESLEIGRYRLAFERLSAVEGPTHTKVRAHFSVYNGHRLVGRMEPALRFYPTQQAPIAEVDYWIGLREDLYLILGSFDREGAWVTAKALVNPLVTWLWIGGGVMALGTLLALLPGAWLGSPATKAKEGDLRA
ncbi:MAG: heme lyase CcmF/NrfE family subunit [Candidatus Rokubacteria bacterium]|nr:heme lyase CcmF/NrfE family subunit [Candidatus Rokubacteria bacterium]